VLHSFCWQLDTEQKGTIVANVEDWEGSLLLTLLIAIVCCLPLGYGIENSMKKPEPVRPLPAGEITPVCTWRVIDDEPSSRRSCSERPTAMEIHRMVLIRVTLEGLSFEQVEDANLYCDIIVTNSVMDEHVSCSSKAGPEEMEDSDTFFLEFFAATPPPYHGLVVFSENHYRREMSFDIFN